jgi:glycosyltransferase involved in cell wall biosynthesis
MGIETGTRDRGSIPGAESCPRISVVIPSYNKAAYLGATLESIAAQDYPSLEIIIQDGGSTDGSVDIIRRFADAHPGTVRWVSAPDGGQLDAINQGLAKATGDIVAEIDSDDLYRPGAFRRVADFFRAHPDRLWAVGKGGIIDNAGRPAMGPVTAYKNLLLGFNRRFLLYMVNYVVQPAVFFRREAFERFGLFTGNASFVMEYELWLRLARAQMPGVIPAYLADYRLTLGTISSTQADRLLDEDLEVLRGFTRNPALLGLHRFHNALRKAILHGVRWSGGNSRYR